MDLQIHTWHSGVKTDSERVPCGRQGHSAALFNNEMYIFSGRIPSVERNKRNYVQDFWKFNLKTKQWTEIPLDSSNSPCKRNSHSAIIFEQQMFIFGGSNEASYLSDLWSYHFESNQWTLLYEKSNNQFEPGPRHGHSACLVNHLMIVFGGKFGHRKGEYYNSTFAFDCKQLKWIPFETTNNLMETRCWHTCTFLPLHHSILLFGGFKITGKRTEVYYNDVWMLHLDTNEWKPITTISGSKPHVRNRHIAMLVKETDTSFSLVFHSGNFYEGHKGDLFLNDAICLKNTDHEWKWIPLQLTNSTSNRGQHTVVQSTTNEFFIFGGELNRQRLNDVLQFVFP